MNDNRFKELLNLHLDHRLSADEARELEQALHADPVRRREFRHYTALQRGCSELFRRSAADAPAPDSLVRALRDAEARMSARGERRTVAWGWSTWGATAGMAAVVALVVARVSLPTISVAAKEENPTAEPAGEPTAVAVNTAPPVSPYIPARSVLPEHLTLAALGIASEQSQPALAMSRWQNADESQVARLDNAAAQSASWMNGSSTEWNGSTASAAQFVGRPINAWGAQSGYQVQTASYTFER